MRAGVERASCAPGGARMDSTRVVSTLSSSFVSRGERSLHAPRHVARHRVHAVHDVEGMPRVCWRRPTFKGG